MTERAQAIRRDLEALRNPTEDKKEWLAGPDYMMDWIAEEIERDEIGGFWVWPDSVKPRKKRAKVE